MSRLKGAIQDESALRVIIDVHRTDFVTLLKKVVGNREEEYKKYRWQRTIGLVILFTFPFITLLANPLLWLPGWVSFPLAFGLIVLALTLLFSGWRVIREFHSVVDRTLYPPVLALLGLSARVVSPQPPATREKSEEALSFTEKLKQLLILQQTESKEKEIVLERLSHSLLITEPYNTTQVDLVLECTYEGVVCQVAELDVAQVTGSGKNRSVRQIFHGYFVEIPLTRPLEGKTFVTAEKDTTGFGHRSLRGGGAVETVLEWNEFEELLHVATTNEVEARYILTPNFMTDLYTWWKEQAGEAIRVSFIGQRMYILFPDRTMKLRDSVAALTEEEVSVYAFSIARPFFHIAQLLEDVRL